MTLIVDTTPVFPSCPGYSFKADPYILVKIIEREGGFERTDRKWSQARRQYDGTPLVDRVEGEIEEILYFWLAIGGMSGSFRFKDYTDYKSCRLAGTPAATDQPLVEVDESPGGYRLVKQYTFGALTHVRPIKRPIGDTILIANEVGALQADTLWELNEATGIVNPVPGFVGTPTFWGGEFEVLCRFNSSFAPEIVDGSVQSADVSIIERREA